MLLLAPEDSHWLTLFTWLLMGSAAFGFGYVASYVWDRRRPTP
jgi:hypothetical protein